MTAVQSTICNPQSAMAMTMLTPAQIAKRFNIGAGRVQMWIQRGELVGVLVSTNPKSAKPQYRVSPSELDRFAAARTTNRPLATRRLTKRQRTYRKLV